MGNTTPDLEREGSRKKGPGKESGSARDIGWVVQVEAPVVPVFTHENLLHAVTQFVAADDQVRSVRS